MNVAKVILYPEHNLPRYLSRVALTLFVISTLNGCSSSGGAGATDDPSTDAPSVIETTADETNSAGTETGASDLTIQVPATSNTGSVADPEAEDPQSSSVVPAPLLPATVQVDFDITVPAYMSNELLIQLDWGSINKTASWIRDESWFISENFPVNTENLLVVTFADRNGELELGTYEQLLATTSGTGDSYLIQADQFDTDRWDSDGDGISNLNEVLAGNDPLIDESQSLEIRDGFDPFGSESEWVSNLRTYSGIYEANIPDERPYFEDVSVLTPVEFDGEALNDSASSTIDIDANGNGTLVKSDLTRESVSYFVRVDQTATRTNTGNSIQWSGTHSFFNVEIGCGIERQLQSETRRINDSTMSQDGSQNHTSTCDGDSSNIGYTLTGVVVDDSSLCEATTGTITTASTPMSAFSSVVYYKEPDDIYWTVNRLNNEGQLVEEYLVPIDIMFYCDFVDL